MATTATAAAAAATSFPHPASIPSACLQAFPQPHSCLQVFSGFRSALLDALADTVRGPERFAQTGTGWVLREVGKADAAGMVQV